MRTTSSRVSGAAPKAPAHLFVRSPDVAVNALARCVVGAFVPWIRPAVEQIPLCTGARSCHETHLSRAAYAA